MSVTMFHKFVVCSDFFINYIIGIQLMMSDSLILLIFFNIFIESLELEEGSNTQESSNNLIQFIMPFFQTSNKYMRM